MKMDGAGDGVFAAETLPRHVVGKAAWQLYVWQLQGPLEEIRGVARRRRPIGG